MPMSNNRVPFVKMNGAGNQIVVADMRGHETFVSPQAAITLSSDPATRFDQLMEVRDSDSEGVRCSCPYPEQRRVGSGSLRERNPLRGFMAQSAITQRAVCFPYPCRNTERPLR